MGHYFRPTDNITFVDILVRDWAFDKPDIVVDYAFDLLKGLN